MLNDYIHVIMLMFSQIAKSFKLDSHSKPVNIGQPFYPSIRHFSSVHLRSRNRSRTQDFEYQVQTLNL